MNKIKMAIKLILEALRETKDPETKYYLTQAHNELMKVYLKENSYEKKSK